MSGPTNSLADWLISTNHEGTQSIVREHAEKLAAHCDQMLKVLWFFTLHGTAGHTPEGLPRAVSERVGEPIAPPVIVNAVTAIAASIDAETAKLRGATLQ